MHLAGIEMKSLTGISLGLTIAFLNPNPTSAQELRFNDLVQAKMVGTGKDAKVVLMVEAFRQERKKIKTTTEIFSVEDDGQTGDRLGNPRVAERVQVQRVPAGLKPKTLDAKDFQFFDLSMKPVTIDDAAKQLTQLRSVFLYDQGRNCNAATKAQLGVLRDDCLILKSKKQVRDVQRRHAMGDPFGAGADPFN